MASATLRAAVRQIIEEDYGRSGCGCIRQTINDNKRKTEKKDAEEKQREQAFNLIREAEDLMKVTVAFQIDHEKRIADRLEEAIKLLKGA